MSAGVKGGYTAVYYGTTVGMQTSSSITGLLNGTVITGGEATSIEDAAGQFVQTGYRQTFEVHTSLVTGTVITALIAASNACTPLWFRFIATGSKNFKLGGTTGNRITVRFQGSGPGDLHRHIISGSVFVEDANDALTVG